MRILKMGFSVVFFSAHFEYNMQRLKRQFIWLSHERKSVRLLLLLLVAAVDGGAGFFSFIWKIGIVFEE